MPDTTLLNDWKAHLHSLCDNIKKWAQQERWLINSQPKQIEEKALGPYEAELIQVKTPQGMIVVDPIAASITGAKGRVDLYAFPSLNRVRLLWNGNKWIVRTDSGINLKETWGKKTFVELARDLTAAP